MHPDIEHLLSQPFGSLPELIARQAALRPGHKAVILEGQSLDYAALRAEWRMLSGYRAAWAAAPYPPVFVTVDALLRCQGRVLLIRRGHAPGELSHAAQHHNQKRIDNVALPQFRSYVAQLRERYAPQSGNP